MSVENFLNLLRKDIPLAYDVETNGLKWQTMFVCGYSISDGVDAFYVPVRHGGGGNIDNPEKFEEEVAKIINERTSFLITHNGKFDSHFSLNHGIELGNKIQDTMIAAALLDEYARSYSLKNVAGKYPLIPQKKDTELYKHLADKFNVAPKASSMGEYWRLAGDDPIGAEYARFDTLTTWHLHNEQKKELYEQRLEYIYALENKLLHVLRKMERRGIYVNPRQLDIAKARVEELRFEYYGKIPINDDLTPMNVRSNKDLEAYFKMHELTDWDYTAPTTRHPNGQPSFNKLFLGQSEEGKILLQARGLDHFANSFVEPAQNYIYKDRMYTNFNQTLSEFGGTKSGRLSSNNPNMQQVPKRDKFLGSIFRRIFEAEKNYTFVEFDYSQCEPRLFAHYSGEPVLLEGYNATPPIDMHSVAANYMNISRGVAKNLNLGLQYTMGIAKLAVQLGIPEDDARQMYYRWKRTFPKVSEFTKLAENVATQRGYVKTILGRRARFPDARWSYRAANRIVQGGSADILKYKIVEIDDYIARNNLEDKVKMILNIHDAILFEIADDILEEQIKAIEKIMTSVNNEPFNLKLPFTVDYHKGKNWSEASYGE